MVDAGTRIMQAASAELGPALAVALDPAGSRIPTRPAAYVAKSTKSIAFSQSRNATQLADSVVILAVYGQVDRAAAAARILTRVPKTSNMTVFEPLRAAVVAAAWFQPVPAVRAELEALAKADWKPHPGRAKGVLLCLSHRRSEEELARSIKMPPHYYAGDYLMDIRELTVISFLGGSLKWSRKKVTAEIDLLTETLFALPGYEPLAP